MPQSTKVFVHGVPETSAIWSPLVTRTDTGITALRVNCTHAGFPVARVGNVLECELHGSQFEPGTGAVVTGPAARALFRYEATESNNGIYVTVRNNV